MGLYSCPPTLASIGLMKVTSPLEALCTERRAGGHYFEKRDPCRQRRALGSARKPVWNWIWTARIGLVGCCESFAHIIHNPRVGSRSGSVRYADRGLVDRDRVGILLHEYMVDERTLTRVVLPECDAYNGAYRQAAVFAVWTCQASPHFWMISTHIPPLINRNIRSLINVIWRCYWH